MTINEFIDYLKSNPDSVYNMQSLVNTINHNVEGYKHSYIDDSIEYHDLYFFVISTDEERSKRYAMLYYKYIEIGADNECVDSDDFNKCIIQPCFLRYYERDRGHIYFNSENSNIYDRNVLDD